MRRGSSCSRTYLVHHEDLARCAQASLEWLGRHAGVRALGLPGGRRRVEHARRHRRLRRPERRSRAVLVAVSDTQRSAGRRARRHGADGLSRRSRPTATRTRAPTTPLGTGPFTAIPLRGSREGGDDAGRPAAAARALPVTARCQLAGHGARPEDRADPRPRQPGRGSPEAAPRARAVLHDHQRGHRPDSADRHRRPPDRRQRARREAVRRHRGGERRPPPRRRAEQHAVLGGAVAHGGRGAVARRASCCWSTRATARTCCSSCSARPSRIRARAPASSRCCATSPTCGARPSRSRRTTRSCASPRRRRAPSAIA